MVNGEGVHIRPDVEDMRASLKEAWVCVVPMRCGTGVKNKVLEAWSVGRPTVMTPIACNGIAMDGALRDLVCASPASFAERVVELLGNQSLRHLLGAQVLARAQRYHAWPGIASDVSRTLERVSESPPV